MKRHMSMTGGATHMPRRNVSLRGSAALRAGCFTIAALFLLGAPPVLPQAHDAHVEEIIGDPTAVYRKTFGVDTTPEVWNRVLDNLYLMGRLWGVYGFQPAYEVTRTEPDLHVVDPTGIVGDVREVGRSELSRRFYGQGAFNHWAVPSFFTADGVILFEWTAERNRFRGEVKIFLRGNNWISKAVMTLFSGTLSRRIDNRFTNNMADMKKIIGDITGDPAKVRNGLTGPLRDDFDRAFPAREIEPAEE